MNNNSNNTYDIIHSQPFLINIVKKIETLIKHELSDAEEDLVIMCINKIPNRILKTSSVEKIINIITDTVISELHREHCMSNEIDTHEMLKKQIGKWNLKYYDILDENNNYIETLLGQKELAKKFNVDIEKISFLIKKQKFAIENKKYYIYESEKKL